MKATFLKIEKIFSALCVFAVLSACESPSQTDLSALTGVSSDSSNPNIGTVPHTIQIFSGNGQTAVNGTQLSNPLTAKVVDATGNPVPNVSVTFAAASGGGSVSTTQPSTTDSSGQASATVILGATLGAQTFSATMPSGSVKTVNFNVTSTTQSTSLRIYQKTGADCLTGAIAVGATALNLGSTLNLCTVLVNSSNLIVAEVPATWWVTGSLVTGDLGFVTTNPGNYTIFSPTAVSLGTINAVVTDSITIAAYNITATTAATGQLVNTTPLTPDVLSIFSGNAGTGQVGTNIPDLVAKVTTSGGAPVQGIPVTLSITGGGGTLVTAPTVNTNASGLASFTVTLGGVVGANAQSFTASMPTGTTKQVLFTATGTNGPSHHPAFFVQPAAANTGSNFGVQPVVRILDSYGNVNISDNSTTVTISKLTGSGILSGTLTKTAISGVATFTDLSYDTAEVGVSLRATASALVPTADSNTFTVGEVILTAQCAVNGGGWNTADGGCKDLTSGLVWSATTPTTYTWHQAAWDYTMSGSSPETWESDRGFNSDTFDISGTYIRTNGYDSHAAAYCHDLTQSGYSDWRLPTLSEAMQTITNGASVSLKDNSAWMWTGSVHPTAGHAWLWVGTTYTAGILTNSYQIKCVRQPSPTKLIVMTQVGGGSAGLGVNVPFAQAPAVRIADSTNSTSLYATAPVTLTITTGTGLLCNTSATTGVTNNCSTSKTVNAVNGVATFSGISYSKAEAGVVLTATSTGLTSVTLNPFTMNQTYPRAACKALGNVWLDGVGGCKDFSTGLIFSSSSTSYLTWSDAIWDQNSASVPPPTNSGTADSDDNGTNEYDSNYPAAPNLDTTTSNYCHSLQESGQTDWFLPTVSTSYYYNDIAGKQLATYLNLPINTYYWTSGTYQADKTYGYIGGSSGGGYWTYSLKTNAYNVFCQRRDPPASIVIFQQPAFSTSCTFSNTYGSTPTFNSNCNGAGVAFNTQPIIKIVDSSGAGPLAFDASSVTFTVVPASDTTGGTGRLLRYGTGTQSNKVVKANSSLTVTATNGLVTMTGLAYDTPGEKFRIRINATGTWHGVVYNLPAVYTNDLETAVTYAPTQCTNPNGTYANELGGCRNKNSGGIVWAVAPGTYGLNWSQAIWDSANGDARKVLSSDGVTLEPTTTDMDPINAVGVGTDTDNYDVCHRMYINGYYDWRMPTYDEMNAQASSLGDNMFLFQLYGVGGAYVWVSKTDPGNAANSYMINAPTFSSPGTWYGTYTKTYTAIHTVCVRDPNPTSLYMFPNTP